MKTFDFRSDTVTKPTEAMREVMAKAVVGDDVYHEDPTVNRLEEMTAQLLGKEAALFLTSGTMGNLVGVLSQCQRGDEAIMGTHGHTFLHEAGGVSVLGGVSMFTVQNDADGTIPLDKLEAAVRNHFDVHEPITRLVILENTQNFCGGTVLAQDYVEKVAHFCKDKGLALHIDGARLFNAAVALDLPVSELVQHADTVTFCLSKGLGAPVGSMLAGSKATIQKARRLRKILGGGMRQAGILAAAGIYALEYHVERLRVDHVRAAQLAHGLSEIPGVKLTRSTPHTNLIFLELDETVDIETQDFIAKLDERGVLIMDVGSREFRLVTHLDTPDEAVEQCIHAFEDILN